MRRKKPQTVGPSRCTKREGGVNWYCTILTLTYFNPIQQSQRNNIIMYNAQEFYMETQFGKKPQSDFLI